MKYMGNLNDMVEVLSDDSLANPLIGISCDFVTGCQAKAEG